MEQLKIKTSANIDIEYNLATILDRILATIIDSAIVYIICITLIYSVVYLSDRLDNMSSEKLRITIIISCAVLISVFYLMYHLICELTMNGQSFGKKIMGTRVVCINGESPRLKNYLIRWVLRPVDIAMTSGMCAIIMYLLNENHQRLGDNFAQTAVIKNTPPKSISNEALVAQFGKIDDPEEDQQQLLANLTYPESKRLTLNDIALIRKAVRQSDKSGNTEILLLLSEKLEHKLLISRNSKEPRLFLGEIVTDYYA